MKDKLIRIEPVERTKFDSKKYLRKQSQENTGGKYKKNDQQNFQKEYTEKVDTQKSENQGKNRNLTTEDAKTYMEANSPSSLYRLMNIMNKDSEEAIKYLAELSKKNAKRTKPSPEKDDVYNR